MEIEQNAGDHDYMSSVDIKTLVSPEVLSVFYEVRMILFISTHGIYACTAQSLGPHGSVKMP